MPPKIDQILEILKDGKWHNLKEILEKCRLHQFKLKMLTDFLSEYRFIELDRKKQKVRTTSLLSSFLKETEHS